MCGIIGFSGRGPVRRIIHQGLADLEYRGYDSCGFALADRHGLAVRKMAGPGRVGELAALLPEQAEAPCLVIAHTRWATHGAVSEANAHPQTDNTGQLALVHNGIIENHHRLREELAAAGCRFRSQTDTEAAAHLLSRHLDAADLPAALAAALARLEGDFAFLFLAGRPPRLAAVRRGSPLVAASGGKNIFFASDARPLLRHTGRVLPLEDGEAAVIENDRLVLFNFMTGRPVARPRRRLVQPPPETPADNGGDHMLSEICEQPAALTRGCAWFDDVFAPAFRKKRYRPERITIIGCGTSFHAGLLGEYMMEEQLDIPVEVEYASEYRYRKSPLDGNSLVIAISQSGETADTLGAVRAVARRAPVISICNAEGSALSRLSEQVILNQAGPEIGVASTKAFTSQVMMLYLLTGLLAGRSPDAGAASRPAGQVATLAAALERLLEDTAGISACAAEISGRHSALFLGRGYHYPVALEGALKLKEISYIHAEGYPAAEMKHGPIALVDENLPVFFINAGNRMYRKTLGNMEEVRARGGMVISICDRDDPEVRRLSHRVLPVPRLESGPLQTILTVVPLQLLAYRTARHKGLNADRPRNLAKSVTVE